MNKIEKLSDIMETRKKYIQSVKDEEQKDFLIELSENELDEYIKKEKRYNEELEKIKQLNLVLTNVMYNNNERVKYNLYKSTDKIYTIVGAGLKIRKYKIIGRRKKIYEPEDILTIFNLEKIFKSKIIKLERKKKEHEIIQFNISNIDKKLKNSCYKLKDGKIKIFYIDYKERIKSNKKERIKKLEIKIEESKEMGNILKDEIIKLENKEIIKLKNEYNSLLEYNEKIQSDKNDLIRENNKLKSQLNSLRKNYSMIMKKYNNLNKKYKQLTGKDFNG